MSLTPKSTPDDEAPGQVASGLLLGLSDLQRYWETARQDRPLIIVGMGRWGRVLAGVAGAARGSGHRMVFVARANAAEASDWRDGNALLRDAAIAPGIADAAAELQRRAPETRPFAIVAGRPRDHARDALAALELGLPVLVEKPLTDDPATGRTLIAEAERRGQVLGLGVEFSLLPVLHYAALQIADRKTPAESAVLTWDDPAEEVRHGDIKRRHDEVTLLEDLLPHALSIFRVLAPGRQWSIEAAWLDPSGDAGTLQLRAGSRFAAQLVCNRKAAQRRRILRLAGGPDVIATMDFTDRQPALAIGGQPVPLPEAYAGLDSTLRLEIGAFLDDLAATGRRSPVTTGLAGFVDLQAELRSHLSLPGGRSAAGP